ncbi:EGF family domain-containing protein [Toxoplasma gondii FOU]|uniref:EGF family domain-containing protein n=1 Tax=Toxoplasma gondii FOU TaxID=943167 RepID=A0A086JXZ7_TOXGO|nr:EGF family domain-containing protein [Toxoplasma gondii FOU]
MKLFRQRFVSFVAANCRAQPHMPSPGYASRLMVHGVKARGLSACKGISTETTVPVCRKPDSPVLRTRLPHRTSHEAFFTLHSSCAVGVAHVAAPRGHVKCKEMRSYRLVMLVKARPSEIMGFGSLGLLVASGR